MKMMPIIVTAIKAVVETLTLTLKTQAMIVYRLVVVEIIQAEGVDIQEVRILLDSGTQQAKDIPLEVEEVVEVDTHSEVEVDLHLEMEVDIHLEVAVVVFLQVEVVIHLAAVVVTVAVAVVVVVVEAVIAEVAAAIKKSGSQFFEHLDKFLTLLYVLMQTLFAVHCIVLRDRTCTVRKYCRTLACDG